LKDRKLTQTKIASTRLLIAITFLLVANGAFALQPAELVGRWTVTWSKNQTQNLISLSNEKGQLSGNYTSDDGTVCDVFGKLSEKGARLLLQIKCGKWNEELKGTVSSDGGSVAGFYIYHYQWSINDLDSFYIPPRSARGQFAMSKNREP
jgi:hypothetical protein